MRAKHKFEEMFPREFRAEFAKAPVIYCSFGGVEYHGTHNSLTSDFTKGREICLRAAAIAGGIVHPTIPIVPGGAFPSDTFDELKKRDFHAYPGVFGGRDLCEALFKEVLRFFAECLRFKVIVAFGAHGPAKARLDAIAKENNGEIGGARLFVAGVNLITDLLLENKAKYGLSSSSSHGGMWETSINMAIAPASVDLSELDKPLDGFWPFTEDVIEECKRANAEFGEKLIDTAAKRLAEKVMVILKDWEDR